QTQAYGYWRLEYTAGPGRGQPPGREEGTDMTAIDPIDIAGLDGGPVSLVSERLEDLDSRVPGRLLRPGDQGWNEAVSIWNGMAGRLPALVLQPASAHDVAAAVGFARDHGLLLSIKGGGHNIAGTSMAPGG